METSLSADGCDGLDEDCFGWENENIGETVVPEWLKISSVMASSDSSKHLRCTPRENHVHAAYLHVDEIGTPHITDCRL